MEGHAHPITLAIVRISEIFSQMGFDTVDGPELEDEWHNFDALNVPKDHPARDMQDTFWLKPFGTNGSPDQTSSGLGIMTQTNKDHADGIQRTGPDK